ncbi:MAG TPA: DUF2293 domain-containing protein, partial [Pyrinomonadaceae bacterium]|nr:DUF2293 domain-containing protein [Pyrinomonadaceae bacterium]
EFIDDCRLPIADSKKEHATDSTHRMPTRTEPSQRSNVRDSSERRPRSDAPPQLEAKPADSSTRSDEIKVFISHQNSHCAECDEDLGKKAWITLERDKGALCLACADLDELIFLPAGDAALTRRSRKYSNLSAVVLKFSKARQRYERQGLLVEGAALEQAEAECLADSEIRERRNERARERRAELDEEYVTEFARHVRETFPNCPKGREHMIAEHACLKYSGRIGRSAAAKEFDEEMIALAVRAHVRHRETNYDQLLGRGWARQDARAGVREKVEEIVESWR